MFEEEQQAADDTRYSNVFALGVFMDCHKLFGEHVRQEFFHCRKVNALLIPPNRVRGLERLIIRRSGIRNLIGDRSFSR